MDEWVKQKEKEQRLWALVEDLYNEVADFDEGVREYFDIENSENLEKKAKVLMDLKNGKEVSDKDYFAILDGFDPGDIPDEVSIEVGDREYVKE